MKRGKGRWWKRFCRFWESQKKGKEQSNQTVAIQSRTDLDEESEFIFMDSDGNIIKHHGGRTAEVMHPGYKEHLKEEDF